MNRHYLFLLPLLLLFTCKTLAPTVAEATPPTTAQSFVGPGETVTYVGTYTRPEGHVNGVADGIYRVGVNQETGKIGSKMLVAEIINPSFLKLSADEKTLYAVSELAHDDEPTGFIHAFRTNGKSLTEISKLPTHGKAPCHVEIDNTGKYAVVSNYVGGTVTAYRIQQDGALVEGARWTFSDEILEGKPSWLHSANFSPDNKLFALADKGADRVWMFELHDDGSTLEIQPVVNGQLGVRFRDGSGPRHAEWSADGRFLYVINELSNTVNVVGTDPGTGKWTLQQTISTLPKGYTGDSYCADLHLHPSGDFLYGSNRGHNSIAMFAVDKRSGILTSLGQESTHGEYPRNFAVDPGGKFLYAANQNTDNITTYRIGADGKLTFTGEDFAVATPVCIEW